MPDHAHLMKIISENMNERPQNAVAKPNMAEMYARTDIFIYFCIYKFKNGQTEGIS